MIYSSPIFLLHVCWCFTGATESKKWKSGSEKEKIKCERKKTVCDAISLYLLFNSRGVIRISRKCHRKEIIFGQVASSRTNERRWIRRRGRQTHTARAHLFPPKRTNTLFFSFFYSIFLFTSKELFQHIIDFGASRMYVWTWAINGTHSSSLPHQLAGGWGREGAWTSNERDALAHVKRKSKMGNARVLNTHSCSAYPFAEKSELTDDVWNKIQHDWTCLPFVCALFQTANSFRRFRFDEF